jgi:succinate-semialdehyde dehydrogenase / glutarate-semialdehyde dehydrogenase
MALQSINPATGEVLRAYDTETGSESLRKASAALGAFQAWRRLSFPERADPLRRFAARLLDHREILARLMAQEMGKPVVQGRAEVDKCAWACEHFAEHGARYLEDDAVATEADASQVVYQPLGVILAIMPWNFPLWQVVRCAAPALAAGNVILLKHASNVTGCALVLEELFAAAGLPADAFQVLRIPSAEVGTVIDHPAIRGISLTGSTPAGRAVAAHAGRRLLKTVLELGGSDPYLVLDDAGVEKAARVCAAARMINGGQSCIAAKRFLVDRSVEPAFTRALVEALRAERAGDPLDEQTTLGPMARIELRDALHEQVQRSIALGARCILGGAPVPGPGAFYPPTVLTEVRPGMPVFDEETFGPVAAVTAVADESEAVQLANQSAYGLGAAVFTRNRARGEKVARELEAGVCVVNDSVRSDPRLPFGGIKESGYGRELGLLGIREFVNAKTMMINSP